MTEKDFELKSQENPPLNVLVKDAAEALLSLLTKGGFSAMVVISDTKADCTYKGYVTDGVTNPEEPITPDFALMNAMAHEDKNGVAFRELVFSAVLSYLYNRPEEIPQFQRNFNQMVKDAAIRIKSVLTEEDDDDEMMIENPHAGC